MHGNPLALSEDLDSPAGQPHLHLAAGKAVGNAVEVMLDLDLVINADPSNAPFGEDKRVGRQCFSTGR